MLGVIVAMPYEELKQMIDIIIPVLRYPRKKKENGNLNYCIVFVHLSQQEPFRSAPNYNIDTVSELTRRSATGN